MKHIEYVSQSLQLVLAEIQGRSPHFRPAVSVKRLPDFFSSEVSVQRFGKVFVLRWTDDGHFSKIEKVCKLVDVRHTSFVPVLYENVENEIRTNLNILEKEKL
jgi:hypothetical protein